MEVSGHAPHPKPAGGTQFETPTLEKRLGIAGVKGFCGGFDQATLEPWGEEILKRFVLEAVNESLKLETALARIRGVDQRIALLHYSPVHATIEGEMPEIAPFLGCSRLEEPIDKFAASFAVHGHAHHGQTEGRTARGIPVYNAAIWLLLDRALPFSPYRQWVLSLPFRLRLLLAKEGTLHGKVRTIFMRTVRSWQRLQARRLGLRDAQTAAVCFTQLFGSRLDCSPHFHALAPDAVFLDSEEGDIELWRLPQPTREEVAKLVERIARRTLAMLKKELGEDLRLNALDRLRAVTHQQLSLLGDGRATGGAGGQAVRAVRRLLAAGG